MSRSDYQYSRWLPVLALMTGLMPLSLSGCDSAAPPRAEVQQAQVPHAEEPRNNPFPAAESKPGATAKPVSESLTKSNPDDSAEQLLWESPTSGVPLNLAYLPPGIQAVVAWRPAQSFASDAGKATLESLGRFSTDLTEQIQSRLGFPLTEVDELLIGLLDGELTDAGLSPPRMALVATCRQPIEISTMLPKWNSPTGREQSGETVYEGPENAWYLPSELDGQCLVVAPLQNMADILELAGSPPSLRNELQSLLVESDRDRLLTVIFVPSFLSTGGKRLLTGAMAPLHEQLDWFLIDQALAVLVSAHLEDDLFLETRLYTRPDVRSVLFERDLRARLTQSTQRLSEYLANGTPTPYGSEVLARFPRMWEQLVAHTRSARQDRQVVLRTTLPGVAAHNLALAANLALTEIVPRATSVAATGETLESLTIEERLSRPISLSFPRQTLEQAIELFGREAGIEIEILGGDLQLEGITKNQSFGLEAASLPAAEVLQKILQQASPDGKLIYVIREGSTVGGSKLCVTTQAAAAKRGDTIPASIPPKAQN